jgi:hypothetical protein
MSASSSMTRTEIVPLRMPRPTVLGTPRQIGYLSGEARERAGTAAAGVPPSACSRMTPTDGGPCLSGVALSPYPSRSPSYRSAPVPRRGRSCPGRPPPGDLHRAVIGFVLLRGQLWWRDGASTALSRCRPVARREFRPAPPPARGPAPLPTRGPAPLPGRGPAPPPATGPATGGGDHRPGAGTKSRGASRKAQKQAIGCPLRMPTRLKDLI